MSEARRFCENCGTEIGATTNFCPSCGAAQTPTSEAPTEPPTGSSEPGSIPISSAPDVPPPPQRGGGGRSWGKIALGGCGILVLLFVLMVACALAVGTGGSDSTKTAENDDKEEVKEEKKGSSKSKGEETVAIGQQIAVGDVEWNVTNARQANQLTAEFLEPKQGNFVIVDFTFQNNGNNAVTLDRQSVSLLDNQNRESSPDPDTFGYIDQSKDLFLENVNPGVVREGEVVFTVPPDASDFTLQVGDANLFGGQTGYVDLGF